MTTNTDRPGGNVARHERAGGDGSAVADGHARGDHAERTDGDVRADADGAHPLAIEHEGVDEELRLRTHDDVVAEADHGRVVGIEHDAVCDADVPAHRHPEQTADEATLEARARQHADELHENVTTGHAPAIREAPGVEHAVAGPLAIESFH